MNIKEKSNRMARIDHQEWLVLQVSLHIDKLMSEHDVNRVELAKRLGTGKSYVTQLLDGSNMTLRKIADVMSALDSSLVIDTVDIGFNTTVKPLEQQAAGYGYRVSWKPQKMMKETSPWGRRTKEVRLAG